MFETNSSALRAPTQQLAVSQFMSRTYGWMFIGLMVTSGISLGISNSEAAMQTMMQNPGMLTILMVLNLGVVLGLSFLANKISAAIATLGFLLYAAINGITFSFIFQIYTMSSITQTFLVAAGMFGGMALYGTVTKKDLTGMGSFMIMGVWGLLLVGLVNIFVRSSALSLGMSVVGVIIFTGLAAYDAQKIRSMALAYGGGGISSEQGRKASIFGALALYLDFINLFFYLLRLFGRQRD